MINGLRGASIWSENGELLVGFYREVVKLPVLGAFEGFTVFGGQNATLLIGTHSGVRGSNTDPSRHMISLESDDVWADFTRLRDAGVTVVEEPGLQGPNLLVTTLADPEGNIFQLLQTTG